MVVAEIVSAVACVLLAFSTSHVFFDRNSGGNMTVAETLKYTKPYEKNGTIFEIVKNQTSSGMHEFLNKYFPKTTSTDKETQPKDIPKQESDPYVTKKDEETEDKKDIPEKQEQPIEENVKPAEKENEPKENVEPTEEVKEKVEVKEEEVKEKVEVKEEEVKEKVEVKEEEVKESKENVEVKEVKESKENVEVKEEVKESKEGVEVKEEVKESEENVEKKDEKKDSIIDKITMISEYVQTKCEALLEGTKLDQSLTQFLNDKFSSDSKKVRIGKTVVVLSVFVSIILVALITVSFLLL